MEASLMVINFQNVQAVKWFLDIKIKLLVISFVLFEIFLAWKNRGPLLGPSGTLSAKSDLKLQKCPLNLNVRLNGLSQVLDQLRPT